MSVLKISKEGQLLWTSLLLVWPKSQRKGAQRYRLKDRKSPFAREGCAGQCATVIFLQFMELLLPHLLINGTAVSFKHRQCAANSASYWSHRQDSSDGLDYRRLFVPLRKGEILAPEHGQESSLPEMTVRKQ